jgi:hypothetical protein
MIRKWKRQILSAMLITVATSAPSPLLAQTSEAIGNAGAGSNTAPPKSTSDYYPAIDGASESSAKPRKELQPVFYAARRFSIPFSVAATGRQPVEVQLLLSRDGGERWETYERARPEARGFSFGAEEDGGFWFSLRTIDERGMAYPNQNEMLYVVIDTTKPDVGLSVDMNHNGEIVAQCTIAELWIDPNSVVLEYQTDSELKWNAIPVEFKPGSVPGLFTGEKIWQPEVTARNVMVRLSAADRAGNKSEITRMYAVPRTASLGGLQLASQRQGESAEGNGWPQERQGALQHTPGASPWDPGMSARNTQQERQSQPGGNRRILPGTNLMANPSATQGKPTAAGQASTPQRSVAQWESTKPNPGAISDDRYVSTEKTLPHPSLNVPSLNVPSLNVPSLNVPSLNVPAKPSALAGAPVAARGPGRLAATQEGSPPELRLGDVVEDEPTKIENVESPSLAAPSPAASSNGAANAGGALNPVEELPPPVPMPFADQAPQAAPANTPADSLAAPTAPSAPALEREPVANTKSTPQLPVSTDNEIPENDPHGVPMGPTDLNTYYSRSKSFSLDYDIDMTRGSSVTSVELWGTMDDGKTWSKWGEDEDRESPFDIRVDEEGMFGFRVVIVGSNLIASNQPRAGDPADAWIYVDTKTPDVKIISAVYGSGEEAGNLVIDYSCADDQLIDRPISISFSDRRDGPWTTIASGLKNTGRYLWAAEPNLPKRIYLRIEAVDRAANIGVYRLDIPVDVEGLAPRGRIKGFRPITD